MKKENKKLVFELEKVSKAIREGRIIDAYERLDFVLKCIK